MPKVVEIAHKVLGEVVANSLNTEGYSSAEEFLLHYEVIKEANKYTIGEKNVALLKCAIISQHLPLIKTGQYLSQRALQRTRVLTTGSSQVDKVLGNGLYTCEVVEMYGPSGCGKSQLSFQTAALACLKHDCNVIYVDTSSSFSSKRVSDALRQHKVNSGKIDGILKRISVYKIFDVYQLQDMLYGFISAAKAKSDEFSSEVKLLVIDSVTPLLTPHLGYKSKEGYKTASSVARLFRRISAELYVAVLVINGAVSGQTNRGFPKPALGIQWQQTADKLLLVTAFDAKATITPSMFTA
ncbi:DNA repair protein RAD51 homolog 4-like isoform X2 [Watersipora subatra]|uniref:DNA repair protein RAD51 homolog 4-like isoform X2 n=1 Tax=Watersipora subatra TaxID=2589382 RepID=UPI00355C4A9F